MNCKEELCLSLIQFKSSLVLASFLFPPKNKQGKTHKVILYQNTEETQQGLLISVFTVTPFSLSTLLPTSPVPLLN